MRNIFKNHWIVTAALMIWATTLCSCTQISGNDDNSSLDYSQSELWYTAENGENVDVFYILPTCIWDWTDSTGEINHYADVYDSEQREAMKYSFDLANEIFAENSNFYAPYYRQISLESWIEGESAVTERFPLAMEDIAAAFDYFIDNLNEDKPFIIAGYSQGGKGVVELLKEMDSEVYSRMVAAYVIGYRITTEELNTYDNIKAATGSGDIGVAVCYNSVASAENICPVLSPNSVCINPINWVTDSTPAMLNDSTSVHIDTENSVLIVEGLNSSLYFEPVLADLFEEGNYHLYELSFYQAWLNENVAERIGNWK
ncbi:MAG: DUF3089 domain-containing protein [bacterium]